MQKQVEHDMETFRISDSGFQGFMVSGFGVLGLLLPVNKGTEKKNGKYYSIGDCGEATTGIHAA